MEITHDHVALRVSDLDRSIRFYREIFDLEPTGRRSLGDGRTEQVVYRVGEAVLVLFCRDEFGPAKEATTGWTTWPSAWMARATERC